MTFLTYSWMVFGGFFEAWLVNCFQELATWEQGGPERPGLCTGSLYWGLGTLPGALRAWLLLCAVLRAVRQHRAGPKKAVVVRLCLSFSFVAT